MTLHFYADDSANANGFKIYADVGKLYAHRYFSLGAPYILFFFCLTADTFRFSYFLQVAKKMMIVTTPLFPFV